ncbi:MAG: hypothetical protein MUO64_20205 [Anaerolineales bacterium]|nr:hypothetical protein [Anaerolineales bacterium]
MASQMRPIPHRPAGVIRPKLGDIGHEVELEEHDQHQRDAGGEIACAVEQF